MSEFYDYDDYEPSQEELEESDGAASTQANYGENLKIEFNTENFASGIVAAVTSEVKKNLYSEIVSEIKKDVLEDMREKIRICTNEIIKEIIDDFIENDKITVDGDYWDDEPKQEMTLKQYSKKCIKECIDNSEFKIVTSVKKGSYDRLNINTEKIGFSDYIQSQLGIGNEAKTFFDKEIIKIREQVNLDIKHAFDESTKNLLSQTVLNVLMANDTYKKIEDNISSIANK